MKNVFSAILASATVIFIGAAVSLSQDRNSISGFVFNESRAPVSDAYVELQTDSYSYVDRVRTTGTGMFTFGGLAPGRYYVKVITTGLDFEEQTRSVSLVPFSIVQGRGVATEHVDFYLKPRRSRSAGPVKAPGVVFIQDVPAPARELYDSALEDLAAKNDQAAFDKLKKSIELFPDYFMALDRLGNEYLMRGYYEPAFYLLAKALAVNKRSFSSSLGLGLSLYRLGQIEKAISQFKTALEVDNSSANGHLWLGIALHAKSKFSESLQSLLKANELSSGSVAEVHWQLARVYKDLNRFDKSADELELFLKLSPEAKNAAEIRGIISSLRNKKSSE